MKINQNLKTIVILLILAIFAFGAMTTISNDAFAGDDTEKVDTLKESKKEVKEEVSPSDKKGKFFFKKTCKSCHDKDGDGGEITPVSKTIKQWERIFKKDKHHGDVNLSTDFDETQLIHIKHFLKNHAADSDQPETCG